MADKYDTPLLDIKTVVDRPFIRIDGKRYDLALPQDLSLLDEARLNKYKNRIARLTGKEELTDAEVLEVSDCLDKAARMLVLDLPDEVHVKLTDQMRLAILMAFTRAVRDMIAKPGETEPPTATTSPQTSAKSSQGSNTPTEATHSDG